MARDAGHAQWMVMLLLGIITLLALAIPMTQANCTEVYSSCPSLNRTVAIDLMFDTILAVNSSVVDYWSVCISTPAWSSFVNNNANPYKILFYDALLQCYASLNPVVCYSYIMTEPLCNQCWASCNSINATMNAMTWFNVNG